MYCLGSFFFITSICWSQNTLRNIPSGNALCTSLVLSCIMVDKSVWRLETPYVKSLVLSCIMVDKSVWRPSSTISLVCIRFAIFSLSLLTSFSALFTRCLNLVTLASFSGVFK